MAITTRFTDSAKNVLALAQREAAVLHHTYIGVEHILLGLIAENKSSAAQICAAEGMTQEATREAVCDMLSRYGHLTNNPKMGINSKVSQILRHATKVADEFGHQKVTPEHLLFSLLKLDGFQVSHVLQWLGVTEHKLLSLLTNLLTND